MKRGFLIFVIGATVCLTARGQSPNASAQAGGQASVKASTPAAQTSGSASAAAGAAASPGSANAGLASGTTFNTKLSKPVDAKKAKAGDAVEARTTEAVKSGKRTVLPKGTRVVGHVTQSSARTKGESTSTLAIVFDRAILKDGTAVPLNVGIQALASSESAVSSSGDDFDSMPVASAGAGASGSARGALGGVGATAGGAAGGAGAATGSVVNTAGGAVNTATSATANVASATRATAGGLNAAGQLTSNSRGVFGLNGLNLNSGVANSTQGSVITSPNKNIHLASGTQMLLVTQASGGSQ